MARLEYLFPIPVYFEENLLSQKENKLLEDRILKLFSSVSVGGDWNCNTFNSMGTYDLREDKTFSDINKKITHHVNLFAATYKSDWKYEINCSWFNVASSHQYQEYHNHPDCIFSAVYYVSLPPGSGNIIFKSGEDNMVRAKNIVEYRKNKKIKYNSDLIEILNNLFHKNVNYKFLSRLFQSIRIEVNDEINALKEMLLKSKDFLKIKGRLVIISYHSIEDRIVKNFINKSNFDSTFKTDFYGNKQIFFKSINKKPLVPSEEEIKINPRSRSAKLRIGELI